MTLTAGVYCFDSSAQLTGTLTLDGQGDPNAVFIFQVGSTLTTASGSAVNPINSGQSCKAFWQVGSSATLGTTTAFKGSVLALTSITLNTGASLNGRALALNGAVTLDTNDVVAAACLPRLALTKTVVNTGGGSALASAFTLTATGPSVISGTAPVAPTNAPVGVYTLSESGPSGYTAGSFSCSGGGTLATDVLTLTAADAGNTITCTITNTDTPTHLIINKVVVNTSGGVLTPAAFSGTITGAVVATGGNTWSGASTNRLLTTVGAYSVSETAQAGYTGALSTDCSGTIAVGETKTCTITNTFNPPRLALTKTVVNTGGGGALASAFTLTATGPSVISGTAPVAPTNAPVGVYTLSESGPTGYTSTGFSCSGGGTLVGNKLTIGLDDAGNTITCSITNTFTPVLPMVESIPTLSEWAMLLLASLMAWAGVATLRRQTN